MSSMEEKVPIPPAVNSLLSTPSRSQSVLLGREPPTDRENEPRAATSLAEELELKKLPGLVSAVAPEVRVASCTKSQPLSGSWATSCEVMTWPREGLVVSTATASAETSTEVATEVGDKVKSSSRDSSTCRRRSLETAAAKPVNSTRKV